MRVSRFTATVTSAQTPITIPYHYYPHQLKVSICRQHSLEGPKLQWKSLSRVNYISPRKTSIQTVKGINVRPSGVTLKRSSCSHTPKITFRYQSPKKPLNKQSQYDRQQKCIYYTRENQESKRSINFKNENIKQKTKLVSKPSPTYSIKQFMKESVATEAKTSRTLAESSFTQTTPYKNLFMEYYDHDYLKLSKKTNQLLSPSHQKQIPELENYRTMGSNQVRVGVDLQGNDVQEQIPVD